MKKYNLSKIMKSAWNKFRTFSKMASKLSFGECLKRAWAEAKRAARVFSGLVEDVQIAGTMMHPVCVDIDMDALTVTGNTFPARKQLAELGLRWNKELKAWCGSREILNAICVKYAA